jgi:hypothetical protein
MGVTAAPLPTTTTVKPKLDQSKLWLRDVKWDLIFITLSVIVVPLPYFVYLFIRDTFGVQDDIARNAVNAFVAVAVGGPHMMSTFLRTGLDDTFKQRYPMLIRSSVIIPIVVISLAYLNLTLLLTVFFFWAATHVLHQVTYIVELYNRKEHKFIRKGSAVSFWARMIDYAVILTCLFPMAAYKISTGNFDIGVNDLTRVIPDVFQQAWLFYLVGGVFLIAVIAYVIKTVREIIGGYVNVPKTVFIVLTVIVAFTVPMLPNLDTAFQGLNTWHSFQYLALTFYIIKVRQQYGSLEKDAPMVANFAKKTKDSKGLYLFSAMLLVGSAIIFTIVYVMTTFVRPDIAANPNHHFDIAYYTSILSFLWIHYYHDHFLFTNFEALDDAYEHNAA